MKYVWNEKIRKIDYGLIVEGYDSQVKQGVWT